MSFRAKILQHKGGVVLFPFGVSLSLVQLVNIQAFHHLNFA